MTKIRSKLKRNAKGKTWKRGYSSVSNPTQMKHRQKANTKFFQQNLNTAPVTSSGNGSGLTERALAKHNIAENLDTKTTTINNIANSLKSFSIADDCAESNTGLTSLMSDWKSFKTEDTFASSYSGCTNLSFKNLFINFKGTSELHQNLLAVLSALSEIINERNGTHSSTEYYLLLLEQLKASNDEKEIISGIYLMNMGLNSVPIAVLRKSFNESVEILMGFMQRFAVEPKPILKYIISSLAVILRCQDYSTWGFSSMWKYIDALLSFSTHSKPKIRKAAQSAIASIIHSKYATSLNLSVNSEGQNNVTDRSHPAGKRVTIFCVNNFKSAAFDKQQTVLLHTLGLLKHVINGFDNDDVRLICEEMLSLMTTSNILIRSSCFHVLYILFDSRPLNMNPVMCGKLLSAVYEFGPDQSDIKQTMMWLLVLKTNLLHLALLDLKLCMNGLKHVMENCINLWYSESKELVSTIATCTKEWISDCIRPACVTENTSEQYRSTIICIINIINKIINEPFEQCIKVGLSVTPILFEVCGKYFAKDMIKVLQAIGSRYDTQSKLRIPIQDAVSAAIRYMGPEVVLQAIPLANAKGEIQLDISWLLPLLRQSIIGSRLQYFKDFILKLSLDCNVKWHAYAKENNFPMSHTYELLCCQLWGLFPGFCRAPQDPQNFAGLAPTLGDAIDKNPEFRAPIFDGLIELLESGEPQIDDILQKYSKNFLPRLFNVYTQKYKITYDKDLRKKCLEVIKLYTKKTPPQVLRELYQNALECLKNYTVGTYEYDSVFALISGLLPQQSTQIIQSFFKTYITPILLKTKKSPKVSKDENQFKKQQLLAYEQLYDILRAETVACKDFVTKNWNAIENLLLEGFSHTCPLSQLVRLRCLKIMIECRENIKFTDCLILKSLPECVLNYKKFSSGKEKISTDLLQTILEVYDKDNKLNDFVEILQSGLSGDETLISNSIFALQLVVRTHGKNLPISSLDYLLDQILMFLTQKSRLISRAALIYMIIYIKIVPASIVGRHLDNIVKSLSAMTKDTKCHSRKEVGYFLKKLCKNFSAEEVVKCVPGDDYVTHKRIRKIRKQLHREGRKRKEKKSDDGDENYISDINISKSRSDTIDDILADSDEDEDVSSDSSDDMIEDIDDNLLTEAPKSKKAQRKKPSSTAHIRENPEEIVDLADMRMIGNVINDVELQQAKKVHKESKKDINRGFKLTPDGRLIIGNCKDNKNSNSSDSDDSSDDDDLKEDKNSAMKVDLSEDEMEEKRFDKKKFNSSTSLKSVKNKGIHRVLSSATMNESVTSNAKTFGRKVGVAGSAKAASKKQAKMIGLQYKAKKASGDVKRNQKLDPYAYVPLNRKALRNKSKAEQLAYKSLLKGVKKKITKSYKK